MILNWRKVANNPNLFQLGRYGEGWIMRITHVDLSKSDVSAFRGEIIPNAMEDNLVECPDGIYLLHHRLTPVDVETGVKHPKALCSALVFSIQGNRITRETWACEVAASDNAWVLQIRDKVAKLLKQQPDPLAQLARYSTDDLEAALAARKSSRTKDIEER